MKRTFNSLILVALLATQLITPNAFAACTQGGQCNIGGCTAMQYLYNYDFSETCSPVVWFKNTAGSSTIVKSGGTEMCGGYFGSYVRMNYNNLSTSKIWQTVAIPSTETRTHWLAAWNISIDDPHQDSQNTLFVRVTDVTTSTIIGQSSVYYGDTTDPDCRLDILSLGTRNLAGHTIQVEIVGYVTYTDTHFYLTNVSLVSSFS